MKLKSPATVTILIVITFLVCRIPHRLHVPGTTGQVVRRVNGQPQPTPEARVYLHFREHTRINAWGVGPSTPTIRSYDYYAIADENGFFRFPDITAWYWTPLLIGRPRYISKPELQTISTQQETYVVNLTPVTDVIDIKGGTTFYNMPYLIPTNAVFVGKGIVGKK